MGLHHKLNLHYTTDIDKVKDIGHKEFTFHNIVYVYYLQFCTACLTSTSMIKTVRKRGLYVFVYVIVICF